MCTSIESSMYFLKPILHNVKVEYPNCMYNIKAKNNTTCDISLNNEICVSKKLPEMECLESRQLNVLLKLEELKDQLTGMKKDLNLCAKPAQPTVKKANVTTQTSDRKINTSYLQDIVINVNPKNIPFSLLAIKNLWNASQCIHVIVECFTHSTISDLPEEVKKFQDMIVTKDIKSGDIPEFKVSLIWKNISGNTEMNCSPTVFVPIYGEVNILRYLSRIGPNDFNYENLSNATEIDSIFDLCYLLANHQTVKERQNYVRTLNSKLGKSEYYCNTTLSVIDLAVSSVIKQNKNVLSKELTPNMNKWLEKVSCIVGY